MTTSVVSSNSTNMTQSDVLQEKMRMTFRDYFMYAVSGKKGDPTKAANAQSNVSLHQLSAALESAL